MGDSLAASINFWYKLLGMTGSGSSLKKSFKAPVITLMSSHCVADRSTDSSEYGWGWGWGRNTLVHMHTGTYIRTHAHTCTQVHTHAHRYTHMHTGTYIRTHTHTCTQVRTYVHMHTGTYIRTHAHRYIEHHTRRLVSRAP